MVCHIWKEPEAMCYHTKMYEMLTLDLYIDPKTIFFSIKFILRWITYYMIAVLFYEIFGLLFNIYWSLYILQIHVYWI